MQLRSSVSCTKTYTLILNSKITIHLFCIGVKISLSFKSPVSYYEAHGFKSRGGDLRYLPAFLVPPDKLQMSAETYIKIISFHILANSMSTNYSKI